LVYFGKKTGIWLSESRFLARVVEKLGLLGSVFWVPTVKTICPLGLLGKRIRSMDIYGIYY